MRTLAARIKILLLGPQCELGCGAHVYYKDVQWHRDEQCTVVRRDA